MWFYTHLTTDHVSYLYYFNTKHVVILCFPLVHHDRVCTTYNVKYTMSYTSVDDLCDVLDVFVTLVLRTMLTSSQCNNC